jgi:hypothetical protein
MEFSLQFFTIGAIGLTTSFLAYKYGKAKIYEYVMSKVKEELDERMKNEEEMFKPYHKNSSAVLKITQGGKTHDIYVPYDRKKSTSMLRKKVYLMKEGEKIELTQKPGIPYLVSAKMLGGEEIIVENSEGEQIYVYSKEEIPNCF